jgi:hypothetical protein
MLIIGCDFHSRFQQIALLDTETGEVVGKRLEHENGEAQRFYEGLKEPALVGIESMGYTQWFEELLPEFGHELVVGDAAKQIANEVRGTVKQGTLWKVPEGLAKKICGGITAWLTG